MGTVCEQPPPQLQLRGCCEAVVGSLRVQALSRTLLRLEERGPAGFEDRATFGVNGRANFGGLHLIVTRSSSVVRLETEAYVVEVRVASFLAWLLRRPRISVFAPDGSVLATFSDLSRVSAVLDFPRPGAMRTLRAWSLRDSPRFVPPLRGAAPAADCADPPALARTSGYDVSPASAADVYVFLPPARGDPVDAHARLRDDFLSLCGRVPPLPDEAFGTWFSWFHAYDEASAAADIRRWRELALPLDVWGLDVDWRRRRSRAEERRYVVDTARFPNMSRFLRHVRSLGVVTFLNDHPMAAQPAAAGRAADGPAAAGPMGPEELRFRWDGLSRMLDAGLGFWWLDQNWEAVAPAPRFPASRETLHRNVWGQHVYRTMAEAHAARARRRGEETLSPATLSLSMPSSTHPAAHRFPVWWTGDVRHDSLRSNIRRAVNGGLALQPYVAADCGGHYGRPHVQESSSLFVRWVQFCALSPILRFHSNACCDKRPWAWGEVALGVIRTFLRLRRALRPTLVAAGRRATADGTPLVRRLDLEWPDLAAEGAARTDQYLLGDDLLVAPVVPPDGERKQRRGRTGVLRRQREGRNSTGRTWLPPGEWMDAWSGLVSAGPALLDLGRVPLHKAPLWHRMGSVLVTAAPGLAAAEQPSDYLALHVFPFPAASLTGAPAPATAMRRDAVLSVTRRLHETKGAPSGAAEQRWPSDPAEQRGWARSSGPGVSNITFTRRAGGECSLLISPLPAARRWFVRVHFARDDATARRDETRLPALVRGGEMASPAVLKPRQKEIELPMVLRAEGASPPSLAGRALEMRLRNRASEELEVQFGC